GQRTPALARARAARRAARRDVHARGRAGPRRAHDRAPARARRLGRERVGPPPSLSPNGPRRPFFALLRIGYPCAFASLLVQVVGLVGELGILPARDFLDGARRYCEQQQVARWHILPTLCWWNASDAFLRGLAWTGIGLSVLLVLDVAPMLVLPLL